MLEKCLFFNRSEKKEVSKDSRVNTQVSVWCGIFGSKVPGCELGLEGECPVIKPDGNRAYQERNGYSPNENLQILIDAQKNKKNLRLVRREPSDPDFWEGY